MIVKKKIKEILFKGKVAQRLCFTKVGGNLLKEF